MFVEFGFQEIGKGRGREQDWRGWSKEEKKAFPFIQRWQGKRERDVVSLIKSDLQNRGQALPGV